MFGAAGRPQTRSGRFRGEPVVRAMGHLIRAGVRRARAKLEKQQCLPDP